MKNIKYYYEAKSQKELDKLIEYLVSLGYKSDGNFKDDFDTGYKSIGLYAEDGLIYCSHVPNEDLQGELTTDIEVFKAQFKTERTIEDIQSEMAALQAELDAKLAEQPLTIGHNSNKPFDGFMLSEKGYVLQPFNIETGHNTGAKWNGLILYTSEIDIKVTDRTDGTKQITFHKKAKQCN